MCGMSLTNIVKSREPNTEPCGTPLVTILQLDWIASTVNEVEKRYLLSCSRLLFSQAPSEK